MMPIPPARTAAAAAVGLVLLTGCGPTTTGEDAAAQPPAEALTLTDGWVKATDDPMTAAFGTLTNEGDTDLHLTGAESDLAGLSELHVTVDDGSGGRTMQRAEDGFVVPAGGSLELAPGGNHVMLMQLEEPVDTGAEVTFALLDEDGEEHEFTVTARAFAGAEEDYEPGTEHDMGEDGMDGAEETEEP